MTYSGSDNTGGAYNAGGPWRNDGGVQPHAFDPSAQPELFRGVATRRVFAFLIDLVVLSIPVILGYLFIAVFGLLTLGLGWALFWLAWPATVVWAFSSTQTPDEECPPQRPISEMCISTSWVR